MLVVDDVVLVALSGCEASGLGTEMPTLDKAPETADWAELGREPVAAAAVPAVRAIAGKATASPFNVNSFPSIERLLLS